MSASDKPSQPPLLMILMPMQYAVAQAALQQIINLSCNGASSLYVSDSKGSDLDKAPSTMWE
jgi:hypothetical protein